MFPFEIMSVEPLVSGPLATGRHYCGDHGFVHIWESPAGETAKSFQMGLQKQTADFGFVHLLFIVYYLYQN